MIVEPIEYENIIVVTKFENKYNWFVSNKEIWFMDTLKQKEIGIKKCKEMGIEYRGCDILVEERDGIRILSQENASLFLKRMEKHKATTEELRTLLALYIEYYPEEDMFWQFMPSLFVDFDNCVLYSMYTEPMSFEHYVPDGWDGYHAGFIDKLDPQMNYWSGYLKYGEGKNEQR